MKREDVARIFKAHDTFDRETTDILTELLIGAISLEQAQDDMCELLEVFFAEVKFIRKGGEVDA